MPRSALMTVMVRAVLSAGKALRRDFNEVEQRLVKALGWLKRETATLPRKLGIVFKALTARFPPEPEALRRMGLDKPSGLAEWIEARLVGYALHNAN